MNDAFSRWIHSHRDLPMLINQWVNIVRWELRPRLFLRTTEFLWQEGHTAHATAEEADAFARTMLGVYERVSQDVMAIPVFTGEKSANEKFAGAARTYAVEAMMQDGKALQFATSHNLGQNFAKAFTIQFESEQRKKEYVYQTSWGLSTRTIGGLIMAHGDDAGCIFPPRIAPIQVIVVPIWKSDAEKARVLAAAQRLTRELGESGSAVQLDDRDVRPGEKFYEWERKGVPLRVEIGPRDIEKKVRTLARRDTGEKQTVPEQKVQAITKETLAAIQQNLLARATAFRDTNTVDVSTWKEFVEHIQNGKFVRAFWDGTAATEHTIKEKT
ncbi:MAG: His/Gly/Thr/Pro-type tRNA ligase C-terminal domain-containing protein, partial [bacterium]